MLQMLDETRRDMEQMKELMSVQGTIHKLQGLMETFVQATATAEQQPQRPLQVSAIRHQPVNLGWGEGGLK